MMFGGFQKVGEVMRRILFCLLLVLSVPLLIGQQIMNNQSVVKLCRAALSDDLIIATINAAPGNYDTSVDAIIALKTSGASEKVLTAIIHKASASTTELPSSAQQSAHPSNQDISATPSPHEDARDARTSSGSARISAGARIVIAPMGGFETYFAAAVREKEVPVTLTVDKDNAQFFVVSTNTEWEGFVYGSGGSASWNNTGGHAAYGSAASSTRGLEASIMLINAKTKDIVWAYEVHKNSHGALLFGTFAARGQQSLAEACAKHLKAFIEKGN
jgi:hypothetical protein